MSAAAHLPAAHDMGDITEDHVGEWRWHCAPCPGRSITTYPTFEAAYEALKRHHDAAGSLHR